MVIEVNPYTDLSRANRYIRQDRISGKVNCSDLIDSSTFSSGFGQMRQVTWRPPLTFKKVTAGDTHADERGQFSRFIHAKVVFKNLLNTAVTVYVNTPLALLSDDGSVMTRVKHTKVTLDPCGTKVEKTTGKGKKKKTYSASSDAYTHYFSSNDVDRQDTNFKTILKVPVDVADATAYKYDGWVIAEYCVVKNDINLNTGVAYAGALDALEIEFKTKYEVSALGKGTSADDQIKVSSFAVGQGDAKLMFDYDPMPLLAAAKANLAKEKGAFITMETGGDFLGVRFEDQGNNSYHAVLTRYGENKEVRGNAQNHTYNDSRYRFVMMGQQLNSWSYSKYDSTQSQGLHFGPVEGKGLCAVDHLGQPVLFMGYNPQEEILVSGKVPFLVYDTVTSENMLELRQAKISLEGLIDAISIVIKVAAFAVSLM